MILCCGEALIDMIPEDTVSCTRGFVPHSGGAIFNTAIALGRLGCPTGLLSAISTDMFGHQLMADLRASDVDTRFAIRSERPSTLAFVQLSDGHAAYSFFNENTAGRMIQQDNVPSEIPDVSALYFGGISLACDPGAETLLQFAGDHAGKSVVIIDPNIRPSFIKDEDRFRTRIDKMFTLADIVKVSDEDLNWLYQEPVSLEEKVSCIQAHGPSIVILTRGGAGATAWFANGRSASVAGRKVDVVDTVGAGDSFNAGVIANLSEAGLLAKSALKGISGHAMEAALQFGAKVAAVTVSRAGANPPWRSEMSY